jgi:2-aminophenol/2-amino-5-chlorophenol 1,6-dioxygenase subunit alpha
VLGVGGLSVSEFRDQRPFSEDKVANTLEDEWNRRVLKWIENRDLEELMRQLPDYIRESRVDMGFKHLAFALGALGGRLGKTEVYAYGPQYGSGAAVIKLL